MVLINIWFKILFKNIKMNVLNIFENKLDYKIVLINKDIYLFCTSIIKKNNGNMFR